MLLEALETLRAALPYELGRTTYSSYGWTALYPVYVREEAYLAAHQGKEAAAEFQKVLDHSGIVLNGPIGALARLELGRAYALQGDTAKAKTAYQDLLTLEGRRRRRPHPERSQGRIREAELSGYARRRPLLRGQTDQYR
jgi:tetratricopeptide (TPR) repeat protein